MSLDEVSRRSGVAKATIYRHWLSRLALLMFACSQLRSTHTIPDTGSLKGDFATMIADLVHEMRSARWQAILPSIIDAAERDPELAKLHASFHLDLMAPYIEIAVRARQRKELASD